MKYNQFQRNRTYRAEMHDENGSEYVIVFKSANKKAAWNMALAEADARFMSLYIVRNVNSLEALADIY